MEMYILVNFSFLFKIIIFILLLTIKGEENHLSNGSRDIFKYFPEAQNDASNIKFYRANDKRELWKVLKSGIMITGDLWQVINKTIIATSSNSYDLTLEEWLTSVTSQRAGIKLNFKESRVIEPALKILARFSKDIGPSRPVWLSAEVIEGPLNAKDDTLDRKFFKLCDSIFPNSTLSLGWTTLWNKQINQNQAYYPWDSIWEMMSLFEKENIKMQTNFEFRLPFIYISDEQIRFLLDIFTESTITIWAMATDSQNEGKLLHFRSKFNHSRVFYSLPHISYLRFYSKKNDSQYKYDPYHDDYIFSDIWQSKVRQKGWYIGSKTAIVPARGSILMSKHKYGTSANRTVILTGKISVVDNNYYNTLIKINYYNTSSTTPFKNCSFSSKALSGCDDKPKQILLNRYLRCFIFKVEVMDKGPVFSKVGDALRIDACHYDVADYAAKSDQRKDYSIYTYYDKETAWNKVKFFENVSIEIQTESSIGYVVLERLSVLGERREIIYEDALESNGNHVTKTNQTNTQTNDYEKNPDYNYEDESSKTGEQEMEVESSNHSEKNKLNFFAICILFLFYFNNVINK